MFQIVDPVYHKVDVQHCLNLLAALIGLHATFLCATPHDEKHHAHVKGLSPPHSVLVIVEISLI